MDVEAGDITQALIDAGAGEEAAAHRLWSLLYDELRRMAHRELFGGRGGETLTTRALVHEAYLKLVDQTRVAWRDRGHFLALCCKAMRQILIDHARQRRAQKRGGGQPGRPLEEAQVMAETRGEDLLALDEALARLAAIDPRLEQVVECCFYGGLSQKEAAEVLGISEHSVRRDWSRVKTYLYEALHPDQVP